MHNSSVGISLVSEERLLDQVFRSLPFREKSLRTLTDLVGFDRKCIQVKLTFQHLSYSLSFLIYHASKNFPD